MSLNESQAKALKNAIDVMQVAEAVLDAPVSKSAARELKQRIKDAICDVRKVFS